MQPTSQVSTLPAGISPASFAQSLKATYVQEPSGQAPITSASATYVKPGDGPATSSAQQQPPATQPQQYQNLLQEISTQVALQQTPAQPPTSPAPFQYQQLPPQQTQQPAQPLPVGTIAGNATVNGSNNPSPYPKRGFFSIFRRRGETQAAPNSLGLPQQSTQQAFQPAAARPTQPHRPGGDLQTNKLEPKLPRDAQPMQELVGGNWVFVVFAPYFVATALQDTHLQLGLIIATSIAGGVIIVGMGVWALNLRKVFPHILEVLMPIIFAVQLGVTYHSDSYKREVMRTFNFTTNSALAGTCLLSMIICYPIGYQTAQELVHKLYMTNSDVHRCGLYTTAVLTASLVTSCLLYLAPLCKGYDDRHWNALNLIFRIIYPCVATFLALIFVRFFPDVYLPNLAVVHGLNRKPPARLPAYLEDAMAARPPAILDASMYQSSVDAATKAREAATMRPAASRVQQQGLTSRFGPGSVAHGGMLPESTEPLPGGTLPGGMGMMAQSNQLPLDYGMIVPGVHRGVEKGHSVYTYYAAGPPAPPPLAVYAVYGDYDAPIPGPMIPSYMEPGPIGYSNPLMAVPPRGVQPLQYGGSARLSLYGRPLSRFGGGIFDNRRRYAAYAPAHLAGYMYSEGSPPPGLRYPSSGGAGPYTVNMPLGNLATQGHDPAGLLPPMRQPEAVVTGVVAPPYYNQRPQMGNGVRVSGSGGGYYPPGPSSNTTGQWQAPPPPPGSLHGPDSYGTHVGAVSMVPAQQDYGKVLHGPDGRAGYGLNAELQQEPHVPPPAPLVRQQLAPPVPAAYNIPNGAHGGLQPWRSADVDAPVADAPQQLLPGKFGQREYGLDAEVSSGPGVLGIGLGGSTRDAQAGLMGERRPAAQGSGFGLDAEVDTTPPYTPGQRTMVMAPSPQPRVRFDSPTVAGGGGGGGGFGLDAEVIGR